MILLDTHVLIWWLLDHPRLGSKARNRIMREGSGTYVSPASIWEIAIKNDKRRLVLPHALSDKLPTLIEDCAFSELPINARHAAHAGGLPRHHRDPFDRMLIAQATVEGLSLITVDPVFKRYRVPMISAES